MKPTKSVIAGFLLACAMFVWIAWTVSNANYNTNQFSAVYPNLSIKSGVLLTNTVLRGSTTGDAGTIADSLLSSNIPLLNGNNAWTGSTNSFFGNVGFIDNLGNAMLTIIPTNDTINIPSPGVMNVANANFTNPVFHSPIIITNDAATNFTKITGIGIIELGIDGGGSVIATNKTIPPARVFYDGVIIKATLLSDATTLTGIDVRKTNYFSYPPLAANTIVGTNPAHLASALTSQDDALGGWTTIFKSNDVFSFSVISNSAATSLKLQLEVLKQ